MLDKPTMVHAMQGLENANSNANLLILILFSSQRSTAFLQASFKEGDDGCQKGGPDVVSRPIENGAAHSISAFFCHKILHKTNYYYFEQLLEIDRVGCNDSASRFDLNTGLF